VRALEHAFPTQWAEDWDRVGLLAGDPDREITGVTVALDASMPALTSAAAAGDNLLVTHHPAFLKAPERLAPGDGAAGVVFEAVRSGVALANAHTNLDRAPRAGTLIPERLGLTPVKPVESSLQPMSLITAFVPQSHAEKVAKAMRGAGAGRLGEYEGARFVSAPGTGTFTALANAHPTVGAPGEEASGQEVRLEMVAPIDKARGAAAAAREAHPYEEPLVTITDVQIARGAARLGQLCDAPAGTTLASLVAQVQAAFGCSPRVWGDPLTALSRVVTATGSAGSLIRDVRRSGADALVAGEVRYHEALNALESGVCVVELGHDVSEWPLVSLLEEVVLGVDGVDPDTVHVLPAAAGWWVPDH
jgi:putative NIF3 family GTP cyclohydrolase 1 type 2